MSLFYTQACALNVIGLWYSREKQLTELGQKQAHKLFAACSQLGLLCENSIPDDLRVDNTQLETSWIRWCLQEERRRTGLFIWVSDKVPILITINTNTNAIFRYLIAFWLWFQALPLDFL